MLRAAFRGVAGQRRSPSLLAAPLAGYRGFAGDARLALAQRKDITAEDMVELNKAVFDSIGNQDFETYSKLTDERLTCWEDEARDHLVTGREFHKFYFDQPASGVAAAVHIMNPNIRFCGDNVAVCNFTRLVQKPSATAQSKETRIWEFDKSWKMVHFHKSV
eukprot:TRINITY_DN93600_c0_g1_i1.p1 TRINITY_DN93600_c0_g1~~TRINITY_DN93600_c0_g1_i1.p1  ORF type:complete len:162 (+),score=32.38 TRINITY_DN93600_c0_g1_i1:73-558(+)